MQKFPTHLLLLLLLASASCNNDPSSNTQPSIAAPSMKSVFQPGKFTAPHPAQQPKTLNGPAGATRMDPYYWLNERDNPAVKTYLEAENHYFDSVLAPVADLRKHLFDEMVARVKQDDNSVPYLKNGYWYYTRYENEQEYPIHCRKKGTLEAAEQILVNVNELAKGHDYCNVAGLNVSPDNKTLFYTVDYSGRNLYKSVLKNLETGAIYPETFDCAFGASAWANDSKTILYDSKDAVTLRTDKIWRHELGTDAKKDVLMYEEKDETAYCSIAKSKSDAYFFINHGYTQNVETHFLDANNPTGQFQVIKPREKDFFYNVEHVGEQFIIRTNWEAPNFRLMQTPVTNVSREHWKDLLPHNPNILLVGFEVFKDYLVLEQRREGLKQIYVKPWNAEKGAPIDFGEPTYDAYIDMNPEFDTKTLRYGFSSLKTPSSVFDYDMAARTSTLKKTEPVLGGFDSQQYQTEFVWTKARDGVMVPVSIVYRKGLKRDGSAPCYLIGYGSYGSSYDPGFQKPVLSLLDRGFVFAIAHIRGGMEMGYKWYEDGKMLKKMNTFYDFIDCADMLCKEKYTASDRLFAGGRSAGGLLMGAVANLRPDLFKGLVVGVPFVDVLTTMSDASIPLTTGEYTEWGNPANKAEYDYMAAYSPYDNLKAQAYPNLFVTTSFGDSQVQYFEPAKWVAKLRDLKTDDNLLIFKTSMSGSHGGSSGRFERLKERAQEYAWMMGLLGHDGKMLKY